MEQSYVIFSDISADIPAGYAKENDIRFISMRYSLGDEDRVCEEIETEEVLKRFYNGQRNGDLTRTSQISPQVYMDVFTPVLREGKDILYLALSTVFLRRLRRNFLVEWCFFHAIKEVQYAI